MQAGIYILKQAPTPHPRVPLSAQVLHVQMVTTGNLESLESRLTQRDVAKVRKRNGKGEGIEM
eukprot:scaffold31148_cov51-Isochrysis_galbana.AAC.1